MAGRDFLEEQRRRQRDLVAARAARQNPEDTPSAVVAEKPPMSAAEKLQNFWFYNKYFVLAGLFLAVVLGVGIAQCAGREKFDTEVILYTYNAYTPAQVDAIEAELEKYGEDINGDGVVNYQVLDCSYTKDQIVDHRNAKESKMTANITTNDQAIMYITDAETFKKLMDRYLENDIEFFVDLDLPDDEGRSILLSEEFYKNVDSQSETGIKLPEGLRISRRVAGQELVIGTAEKQTAAADRTLERIKNNETNEAE